MVKRNLILTACLLVLCSAFSAPAQTRRGKPQPKPVEIEGTYGGLEYGDETGDIGGAMVIIIAASNE